ncbi:hypothetical protein [uncultured Herbaspirillum sp.]|uniref:hypothetical protein n=1 Tax=uncultured Herbaspirillum sp. TaxID=160236 RepID=UPI00258C7538|nr:hypothetical protein [uncultured Herbaspirillum sp.]
MKTSHLINTFLAATLLVGANTALFLISLYAIRHSSSAAEEATWWGTLGTWAGAMGTWVAIIGAALVAHYQYRRMSLDKIKEQQNRAQSILALMYDYRYQLERVTRNMKPPLRDHNLVILLTPPKLFADILEVLDGISVHEQPSPEHVYFLVQAKRQIRQSVANIEEVNDIFSRQGSEEMYEFGKLRVKQLISDSTTLVDQSAKMVRLLGQDPHIEPQYITDLRKIVDLRFGHVV